MNLSACLYDVFYRDSYKLMILYCVGIMSWWKHQMGYLGKAERFWSLDATFVPLEKDVALHGYFQQSILSFC